MCHIGAWRKRSTFASFRQKVSDWYVFVTFWSFSPRQLTQMSIDLKTKLSVVRLWVDGVKMLFTALPSFVDFPKRNLIVKKTRENGAFNDVPSCLKSGNTAAVLIWIENNSLENNTSWKLLAAAWERYGGWVMTSCDNFWCKLMHRNSGNFLRL